MLFVIHGLFAILCLSTCLWQMDLDDYYTSDRKDIAFLRLAVFCSYCEFIGYPQDKVELFYKTLYNEMNGCPTYNFKIPKYKDMKKELLKLISSEENK